MKTIKRIAVFTAMAGLYSLNASAATLSLEPSAISVAPGSGFSIDLAVSGLGNAGAPSVGAFDINIGFDPSALGLVGISLGLELGDVSLGEAIDVSLGEFAPGMANVAEVSFLTVAELDALQPDTFLLATLDFMVTGLDTGNSTVIDINGVLSLGDSLGNPISIDSVSGTLVTALVLTDADGDGVLDDDDNCTLLPNADQRDTNGDNFGNVCDADLDNNCAINFLDLGILKSVFFTGDADADLNGDGAVNFLDLGIMKATFFGPPGPSGVTNVCSP